MGKLPDNFVKAPVFENPLRRTAPNTGESPELSVVADNAVPEPVSRAITKDMRPDSKAIAPADKPKKSRAPRTKASPTPQHSADPYPHRMTIRLSNASWEALQAESFKRSLASEKRVSPSEILRDLVDGWAKKQPTTLGIKALRNE